MREEPRAEFHVYPVGRMREQVMPRARKQHFEDGHAAQRDQHDHERGLAAVRQHLVDHHLERQGGHQCEDLHEEGRQQHLGHLGLVLRQGMPEPGEAELAALRVELGHDCISAEGAADPGAGELPREVCRLDRLRPLRPGALDQQVIPLRTAHHHSEA
ncbi:hypothetical protein D9M69_220200 [compost metagenome]